jgi:hypothetical protein
MKVAHNFTSVNYPERKIPIRQLLENVSDGGDGGNTIGKFVKCGQVNGTFIDHEPKYQQSQILDDSLRKLSRKSIFGGDRRNHLINGIFHWTGET